MTTQSNTKAERIDKLLGDINEMNARKALLMDELNRSIELQRFMPGLFKRGTASTRITGNPCYPKQMKFIVTDGEGEETEYSLLDVPQELWAHMKPKFRAHVAKTGMHSRSAWGF